MYIYAAVCSVFRLHYLFRAIAPSCLQEKFDTRAGFYFLEIFIPSLVFFIRPTPFFFFSLFRYDTRLWWFSSEEWIAVARFVSVREDSRCNFCSSTRNRKDVFVSIFCVMKRRLKCCNKLVKEYTCGHQKVFFNFEAYKGSIIIIIIPFFSSSQIVEEIFEENNFHYFKIYDIVERCELRRKKVLSSVFNISYHCTNYFSSSYIVYPPVLLHLIFFPR